MNDYLPRHARLYSPWSLQEGGRCSTSVPLCLCFRFGDNEVCMVAKILFLGGAVVVGLVCMGLVISALLYTLYCVLAPRLQKRRA